VVGHQFRVSKKPVLESVPEGISKTGTGTDTVTYILHSIEPLPEPELYKIVNKNFLTILKFEIT